MWHDTILGTIGNTPLVKVNRLAADLPFTLLAKVESFSPGASIKDRIALSMIEAAEREGRLRPGGTIIEGTSGNTGTGLALVAIAKGYRCIFTTTDKQSQEKIDVLRALGAEVIVCPTSVAPEDPRSYYSVAARLAREIPNSAYLNQYDNPANAEAHYRTTGPELWEQTDRRITHLICTAGTGGTISGAGKYLKERNPEIKLIGVDPYGSVYFKYFHEGVFDEKEIYPYVTEGVGEDILAQNMDFGLVDDYVRITDKETMQMTRRLSREEGMFVGQSSGMAMAGALHWLRANRDALSAESLPVVILPDTGFRYLSKTFNDNWMLGHGYLERRPELTVEEVLTKRRARTEMVSVTPADTLGRAIQCMTEYSVSQIPVMEDGRVVGSLNETGILNRLIHQPEAREEPVRNVMGGPFPIVSRALDLDQLSEYLESGTGAVLVEGDGGAFEILTKSDLISALANAGRKGKNGRG